MSTTRVNGAEYFYEEQGVGSEAVIFAHGFMFDHRAYVAQIAALSARYRCVAFDWRGQGQSEVTRLGYDMNTLTEDAATLIDQLGLAPCHFVGSSMGGFVGLRLAIEKPELIRSLVLLNSFAEGEPWTKWPSLFALDVIVRLAGTRAVASGAMSALFSPAFMRSEARAADRATWLERFQSRDRAGIHRTLRGVVMRVGTVRDRLQRVRVPVLIVAGKDDKSFSPDVTRRMASALPKAELHVLEDVGHAAAVEQPEAVTKLITDFLQKTSSSS